MKQQSIEVPVDVIPSNSLEITLPESNISDRPSKYAIPKRKLIFQPIDFQETELLVLGKVSKSKETNQLNPLEIEISLFSHSLGLY